MEHILIELLGLERAQQLRDTPTLNLAHENLWLVHLSIILYCHCRNELYIELAARPTGEDLFVYLSGRNLLLDFSSEPSPSTYWETEYLFKEEPMSPMGVQPEVPNFNEGEEQPLGGKY